MLTKSSELDSEFNKITEGSYLAAYKNSDPEHYAGYDALFHANNIDIFVLHQVVELQSDVENVPKKTLYQYSIKTVNELMKRHIKLQKTFDKKSQIKGYTARKTYFVGLATLMVVYQGKSFSIDHQFGSNYFQEQCVLDFDADDNLLQLFGTKSLTTILELLGSPSDMVSFLEFHRSALIAQTPYPYETILANSFLSSEHSLQPALKVEKQLIEIGVLDRHDSRLLNALDNKDDAQAVDEFVGQMKDYSDFWVSLLQKTISRQHQKGNSLSQEILHQMIGESLYTRMKIMEDVFGYTSKPLIERQEGYIIYQHSYSRFGCQYMIVLYGSDENSWLSSEAVEKEHLNMLINLNSQLQNPVMDDLFLLGFDLSNMHDTGDVDVMMDIYHLKATKMTELEQYLHNQVLMLKQSAQPKLRPRAV